MNADSLRRIDPASRGTAMVAGAALAAAALALPAAAQNALGTGNALDANLNTQSGGINRPVAVEDFRRRNLIVTDNVIGGRGFRDSVGYAADGAFLGETGSDDLFQFRSESAWSSVNLVNFGQTFQRFRLGQDIGLVEYVRVGQDQSALALSERLTELYRPRDVFDAQIRIDRVTVSSELDTLMRTDSEPVVIGAGATAEGEQYLIRASPFAGLTRTPFNEAGQLIGLSTFDMARIDEDVRLGQREDAGGIGQVFNSPYTDLLHGEWLSEGQRVPLEPLDERVDNIAETPRIGEPPAVGETDEPEAEEPEGETAPSAGDATFERIRAQVAERYARFRASDPGEGVRVPNMLDQEALTQLEEDLRRLRSRLLGRDVEAGEPGTVEDPSALPGERPENLQGERTRTGRTGLPGFEDEPVPGEEVPGDLTMRDPSELPHPIEDFGLILRHGQQFERLSSGNRDRFNELLAEAERALRDGRYFWAERKFNRALRLTPGHPLATAGLAHTQIGAGLHVSAGLTLRGLFTFQPEMIDARYEPGLVPNRPRLVDALEKLGRRIELSADPTSSAFVLAYVGRLMGEQQYVERGLAAMEAAAPNDPLLPLLKEVWLKEEGDDGGN